MFSFVDHNTGHEGSGYDSKDSAIAAAKAATKKRNDERLAANNKADVFLEHFSVLEDGKTVHRVQDGKELTA